MGLWKQSQNATPTAPGLGIVMPTSLATISMPRRRLTFGLTGGFKSLILRPLRSGASMANSLTSVNGAGTRFVFLAGDLVGTVEKSGDAARDVTLEAENSVTVAVLLLSVES